MAQEMAWQMSQCGAAGVERLSMKPFRENSGSNQCLKKKKNRFGEEEESDGRVTKRPIPASFFQVVLPHLAAQLALGAAP